LRIRLLAGTAVALAAATLLVPAATAASKAPAPTDRAITPIAKNAHAAADHVLNVDYQVQETGYWCGPAATRIALSARGVIRSQADLAAELGTTENGTDWIGQVTGVLGGYVGWYQTTEMPNDPPSQEQKDKLWADVVRDVDNGYAIVANIVAPPGNQPPGYPPETIYHYFTVIGYNDVDRTVYIADPASFGGNQLYWLTFDQLATLVPPKGYSA
jgi:Peptidase_C39 like family